MKISFEEYFEKNKGKLENGSPDLEYLWKKVDEKKKREKPGFSWKNIAAAILVFGTLGMLVRHEVFMTKQSYEQNELSDEFLAREVLYQQRVQQKWISYTQLPGQNNELVEILLTELQRLDTLYTEGLNDIKQNGVNERAIIILFDTYEKRIRILEQLIMAKQKQVNYESKKHKIQL
jgi:hypothetical protein